MSDGFVFNWEERTMKQLLEAIQTVLESGKTAMLCTIVSRRGTTPRGVGTAMAVDENGGQTGTVGGGEAEFLVKQDALALLLEKSSALRSYAIHPGEGEHGAASGGEIDVLFRLFAGEDGLRLSARALALIDHEEGYLVCAVDHDTAGETEIVPAWAAKDDPVLRPYLAKAPLLTEEEPKRFVEPLFPPPRVIVLGGGHVAKALVPVLSQLGLRVWVVEDRDTLCDPSRFPLAERVLSEVQERILDELELTGRDAVISLVRGRGTDFSILDAALRTKAGYIGAIGSHSHAKKMRDQLLSRGFSKEQIARIHSPVGLDIGAESPEEIAVSIAAEWIACRSGKEKAVRTDSVD